MLTRRRDANTRTDHARPRTPRAPRRTRMLLLVWMAAVSVFNSGCSHEFPAAHFAVNDPFEPDPRVLIPANRPWVDTGIDVQAGQAITVTAKGRMTPHASSGWFRNDCCEVGPIGTFLWIDREKQQQFPLASTAYGPAPCYCLIGRIGDGPVFFVGERLSWTAQHSGRLWLGINDFDCQDNSGQFLATISRPHHVQPMALREAVSRNDGVGQPAKGCSVVVFYVDGLRPDVVQEMAAMGHLPNIRKYFVEQGAWLSNTYTVFPSDTITSNGTMWTGCFSDQHGIKGQVRFSRKTLQSESYLEPLGPNRSSRLVAPQGIDRFLFEAQAGTISLMEGKQAGALWRQANCTEVPPIYVHLRQYGSDWATGVLPMMTEMPPLLWTRSMARHLPYFSAHDAWQYIDDANADYARRYLISRNSPVTIIWLPETDSVSHKCCRGQFGETRRTIAQADELIGEVVAELEARGRLNSTYLMLISDHGHIGGRTSHLSQYDVAHRFFHRPREINGDGQWVGGGLGMSVRQHRSWSLHTDDPVERFVFIDGQSDGTARISLPRGAYDSGDWSGPNRPGDLLAYRIAPHLPPVNLVDSLLNEQATHGDGTVRHPIDLVLMKLTDQSLLISTLERGQAVIERHRNKDGKWGYKYTPVAHVTPMSDGSVTYAVVQNPKVDPLRLLENIPPHILGYEHDEETWLQLTAKGPYPDGVVALARHMLWQEKLRVQEQEYAPDLVITARETWLFGPEPTPGTTHGYPLLESMRATWFVHGPNIRAGARIETPCRLADLTPTILDIVGIPMDPSKFDGTPRRIIYQPSESTQQPTAPSADPVGDPYASVGRTFLSAGPVEEHLVQFTSAASGPQPVYWDDVNLHAWQPLEYHALPLYDRLPRTINQPYGRLDLNNIGYNVAAIGNWSVFRLVDDVFTPLNGGTRPLMNSVDTLEASVRHSRWPWAVEGSQALDVSGFSLSDYSTTSVGNLKRIDGAVDWMQQRGTNLDQRVERRIGREVFPARLVNRPVDALQAGFWEAYRFVQRVVIQVLDETVMNGLEDGADQLLNAFEESPAEVRVP